MSTITIKTLWGWRKNEDFPELMQAWDYYSVDQNYEGWTEACEKAIASWGNDLHAHRYIDLNVPDQQVMETFWPADIDAEVVDTEASK